MTRRHNVTPGESILTGHTKEGADILDPVSEIKNEGREMNFMEQLQHIIKNAVIAPLGNPFPALVYEHQSSLDFLSAELKYAAEDSPILVYDTTWLVTHKVKNNGGVQSKKPTFSPEVDIKSTLWNELKNFEDGDLPGIDVLLYYLKNKEEAKKAFPRDQFDSWVVFPGCYVRVKGQWFCFAVQFSESKDRLQVVTFNLNAAWSDDMEFGIVPSRT